MKRRILAITLLLAMVVSMLPVGVTAEGAEHNDQHTCQHCAEGAETTWTKWTGVPTTSGHYYLDGPVELSGVWTVAAGTDIVLCLHGQTITQKTAQKRLVDVKGNLTVVDCTAKTENNVYTAGGFKGRTDVTSVGGIFNIYRGGTMKMYDGKLTGAATTNNGGAVYLQGGTKDGTGGVFYMYGGEISGNKAADGGAVYNPGANTASHGVSKVYILGGTIRNNTATGNGGGIRVSTNSITEVSNTKITANTAANAAAVYVAGAGASVTLTDVEITGNRSTSTGGYGAVNLGNKDAKLTLAGKTVITDNVRNDGTPMNLHFQNSAQMVANFDGLTEGADVGISLISDRITAGNLAFSTQIGEGSTPEAYCFSDDGAYAVAAEDGKLTLKKNADHKHCLKGCACGTDEATYTVWNNVKKLPTAAGEYVLHYDVELTEVQAIGKDVTLCLNGHTITQGTEKLRLITLNEGGKLTITDCQAKTEGGVYTAGKLQGRKDVEKAGGLVYVSAGASLYVYQGLLTGAVSGGNGGGIFLAGGSADKKASFYMYGGEITNNTAKGSNGGGAVYGGQYSQIVIDGTDIRIKGNQATGGDAGAIRAEKGTTLTVKGAQITQNATNATGIIRVTTDTVTNIENTKIFDNTAVNASALELLQNAQVTLTDTEITGNLATSKLGFGAVDVGHANAKLILKGQTKITENEKKDGSYQNIFFRKDGGAISLAGLSGEAVIGVSMHPDRVATDAQWTFTTDVAADLENYCFSDDRTYKVVENSGTLKLERNPNHEHCDKGCACQNNKTFTAWNSGTSLPTAEGNYYLTRNVVLSGPWVVENDITLCLDGFTVTQKTPGQRLITLKSDTLTVTDCVGSGKLEGREDVTSVGGIVNIYAGATMNLYKGKLTGVTTNSLGGAIFLQAKGEEAATLNMYGGTVSGNHAPNGGGIYAREGSIVNLYGGTIENNEATAKSGMGGGLYLSGATGSLGAVTIQGNSAAKGAGVAITKAENGMAGTATVNGTAITDNTATGTIGGGGIAITGEGTVLTMNSGNIYGNHAVNGVGVLAENKGKFTFSGGKIHSNITTTGDGGGVYASLGTTFTMGAGATISGNQALSGGGLYAYRSTVTAQNAVIENNQTYRNDEGKRGGGAGIYLSGATAQLNGTVIRNNVAENTGGGVTANAHAASKTPTTLTIQNASITGNKATKGSGGGGLYIIGEGTTVTMANGQISGNSAPNGGGVLQESKGAFVLDGGSIRNNTASISGGGVFASIDCVFTMNGGTVSDNTAVSGGGIYVFRGTAELKGGTLEANQTKIGADEKGGSGAGLYLSGSKGTLNGVTIKGNTSQRHGAGVAVNSYTSGETVYPSALTITKATITGNRAVGRSASGSLKKVVGNGGGLYLVGKGTTVVMNDGTITNNKGENGAGVVAESYAAFTLNGGKVDQNKAGVSGGGVYMSTNTTMVMNGGSVSNNTAGSGGGGVYFLRSEGTLNGGTVGSNQALKTNGGGVYITGAKVKLSGVTVSNNSAVKNGGGVVTASTTVKTGGVQTIVYPKLTMTAGSVTGNTAVMGAGVLSQSKEGVFNLSGGSITYNKSERHGAGIYASTNTTFHMSGGTVAYNESGYNGGGIYQTKVKATYTGGSIHDNVAATNAGGMMVTLGTVVDMKNVSVYGNKAQHGAGIIMQSADTAATIENCQFYKNEASISGAGLYVAANVKATITDSKFYENVAQQNGAGMFSAAMSDVVMKNCSFTDNRADMSGGGVLVRGNLDLEGGIFTGNTAGTTGGGVATGKMGATGMGIQPGLILRNTLVSDNTSQEQGGGIYLSRGSKAQLLETEITNNTAGAEGGALWAVDDLTMHSVTATGNTSGGTGHAVYLDAAEYDGHSYFVGLIKMSGDMRILDNTSKDMFLANQVAITVGHQGLGHNTQIGVELDSGVLTDRILGAYDYEGGNCVYTITYGDRSLTDPEEVPVTQAPADQKKPDKNTNSDTLTWIILGALVLIAAFAAVVIAVAAKKAKSKKREAQNEEGGTKL